MMLPNMKTKILTVIAFLLAIPTYGISLAIWIFLKYRYDKISATRVLINAAVSSYNNGGKEEIRYAVNDAALPLVFSMFGGKINEDRTSFISGILPHPTNGESMLVTMEQLSENRLLINAKRIIRIWNKG